MGLCPKPRKGLLKKNGKRGLFEKNPLHPKNFEQPKSPISAKEGERDSSFPKHSKTHVLLRFGPLRTSLIRSKT